MFDKAVAITFYTNIQFLDLSRFKIRVLCFDRVARVNFFYKKNKNDVILVKTKKQKSMGCNRVFDRVTPDFFFPCFFFNPIWFQPRVSRIPNQPAGPGRVLKLYIDHNKKYNTNMKKHIFIVYVFYTIKNYTQQ